MKKLEKLIREAVKPYCSLPVALSGGIDSALLAALIKPEFAISVELPGGKKYNEIKYAKKVAKYLKVKHLITKLNKDAFDDCMKIAVRAIGRPIPHFSIFPLFVMFQYLHDLGRDDMVVGDGPDESMCGYTRSLIMAHWIEVYEIDAFKNYHPLINRVFDPVLVYANLLKQPVRRVAGRMRKGSFIKNMCRVEMGLMRKDMNDMTDGIAQYFGIKVHRPFESKKLDKYMFNLPDHLKIQGEYGKYALRLVAEKYLPGEIAWRKDKMGGPVYPVNKIKGWMENGEYDKTEYIKYQKEILK